MSWRAKQKSFQAEYLKRKADKMIEHRNISLADQIFDQLEADILSGEEGTLSMRRVWPKSLVSAGLRSEKLWGDSSRSSWLKSPAGI